MYIETKGVYGFLISLGKNYIYITKKLIKEINKNKYIYNLENKKKKVKTKFSYKK